MTLHALITDVPRDPLAKPALQKYANLLEQLGDKEGAAAARARATTRPRSDEA